MVDEINFKYLAAALLSRINEFLPSWLPGGKIISHEYTCGSIRGGEGKSMKVNVKSGKWADFANGDKGGDLISLYAAIHNITQLDAAKQLSAEVGHRLPDPRHSIPKESETVFLKPPRGTVKPSFTTKWGEPTATYTYRDERGDVLFFICRYDPPDDKKQFIPFSYTKTGHWTKKQWPAPRPLFGLDQLTYDNRNKPVLITEGEKAAIAARQIVGDNYLVMTWPGGAQAWNKADWRPLYEKSLLIWPDADQPGRQCAADLASYLLPSVKEVKIIVPPSELFDGWDAADALAEGYDWDKFKLWAKPLARKIEIMQEHTFIADESPMPTMPPPNINILIAGDDTVETLQFKVSPNVANNIERCQLQTSGKERKPIKNISNVMRVLASDFKTKIWYDEFYNDIMTDLSGTARRFTEKDMYDLTVTIQTKYGMRDIGHDTVYHGVSAYAFQNTKNEPRDWIDSLTWDNTERVSNFFHKYFGANDNAYTQAVSRNFWVSMIARTYQPGCKADNMVILEGHQGSFKSSALEAIAGKWFTETSINPSDKDFYLVMQGALIVEIAELDAFNRAETNTIKKVVSCHTDRYRTPYGKKTQDWPRRCIFAGTTNKDDYLKDETGARRFWPILTGFINLEAIRKDRDQLFAEAKFLFESGQKWHAVPGDEASIEQMKRYEHDVWTDQVLGYTLGRKTIKVQDVLVDALKFDMSKIDQRLQNRVAKILQVAGFKKGWERTSGKPTRVYINPRYYDEPELPIQPITRHVVKNHAPIF